MNLPIVGRVDRAAEQNRARLDLNGVFAISLVAPPGAGKAALVRRTVGALATAMPVFTLKLEGPSPATPSRLGRALAGVRLRGIDLLLVENDGDFVCPGSYKLGAHANVRVTTVFDEPQASFHDPRLYHDLDALVVNKVDRANEAGFDRTRYLQRLAGLNPNLMVFFTSCVEGLGLTPWIDWVVRRRNVHFGRSACALSARPPAQAIA
jgi:hydrogenase nickel incorporation protein HypB